MIARVAEQCFWLARYLERAESTARLLQVNVSFLLDADVPDLARWRPILVTAGEFDQFIAGRDEREADDSDVVQDHMVWDESNPVSLLASVGQARANARTVREAISLETWVELNGFWLWLQDRRARALFKRDPHTFYEEVRAACRQIAGTTRDTVLHDEAFDYMRLGTLLERAGQVCRILDIKYHALGPTRESQETPAESAHWLAILRSCTASEAFFKRMTVPPSGPSVAEFLLFEPAFPRSVMHCLTRSWHFLRRVRPAPDSPIGGTSAAALQHLLRSLRSATIERLVQRGLHAELGRVIQGVDDVSYAITRDYFAAGVTEQVQAT
jgi:uncharacterized alpha-E superfamily protein